MKLIDFTNKHKDDAKLIRSVVSEYGGMEEFELVAYDVAQYGANQGTGGAFIFTDECVRFYEKNKSAIISMLTRTADELGGDMVTLITGFNCLKDIDKNDVAMFFVQGKSSSQYKNIANALAWYAAEEVCRMYRDDNEYD